MNQLKANRKAIMPLVIVLLVSFIICLSSVSAGLVKEHEKDNPNKYGKEKIKDHYVIDIFGWFDEPIAEYVILEHTESCLVDCHTKGKALLHEQGKLFDDIEYYNLGKEKKQMKSSQVYILKNKTTIYEYPTYNITCTQEVLNGTLQDSCVEVQNGTKIKEVYEEYWEAYNNEILEPATYDYLIKAEKYIDEDIDMIPLARGLSLDEWAWYNSSFNAKRNITSIAGRIINLTYQTGMAPDFADVNFVNTDEATTRGFWIQKVASSSSAIVHLFNTTDAKIYYNNLSSTSSPSSANSVYPGLKYYYPLDEGTGTVSQEAINSINNLSSLSGSFYSGKVYNGYMPNNEARDTGVSFANIQSGSKAWSVSFWVNRTAASVASYPSFLGSNGVAGISNHQMKCFTNGQDVACYVKGTGAIMNLDGATTLRQNQWDLVVLEYNGSEGNLYVNGALDSTAIDSTANMSAGGNNLHLFGTLQSGSNLQTNQFVMDDIRFYNHSLSTQEILDLNNSFIPGTYTLANEETNTVSPTLSASISYPANNANTTDSTPSFGCNFTSNTAQNISSVKLNVYDSSNNLDYTNTVSSLTVRSYNATWTATTLSDDVYKFECFGYGSRGVNASTGNYTFGLDSNAPSVTINFPTATSYSYNISNITYSISDTNLKSCWFTNNSGAINYTITCGAGIYYTNATSGSNTWRIYANDSYGNIGTSSVTFSQVNYGIPNIYFNTNTDSDGAVVRRDNIFINVTASETNLKNITIKLYNSAHALVLNTTSTVSANNSTYSVNYTGLSDGLYYFNATAQTNVSTSASTATRSITLDTTAPSLTIYEPRGDEVNSGVPAKINITYSISESNLESCWYSINGGANVSLYIGNPNQTRSNISELADYYKFNQASGTTVNEETHPGFTMTASGAGWTAGYSGNGFNTTTYGITGTGHLPTTGNTKLAGGVWVKKDSGNSEQEIISLDTNLRLSEGYYSGGGITLTIGACTVENATQNLTLGQWTHLGFIFDSAEPIARLYKNGVQIASASCNTPVDATNYYFGRNHLDATHFNGVIDELYLANSSNATQVINSYASGRASLFGINSTAPGSGSRCLFANDTISVAGSTLYLYANDSLGNLGVATKTFDQDNAVYTSSVYETETQLFSLILNNKSYVPTSANLEYDGINYSSTVYSYGSNTYALNNTLDVATLSSPTTKSFKWNWNNETGIQTKGEYTQTVNPISFGLCNATNNAPFVNYTFYKETDLTALNGSISSSTTTYYIGNGTYRKTYSYSNAVDRPSYGFCFSPSSKAINYSVSMTYYNSGSPSKSYSANLLLTSTPTYVNLSLLPTADGIYTTFQIINPALQSITGASVSIYSGSTLIESKTTDGAGTATMFLNPTVSYNVSVTASGYSPYSILLTPSQTSYTITLGLASTTNVTDYTRGINYFILPTSEYVTNNTQYNFNFTVNSSYWDLSGFGFNITNSSGAVLASVNSTGIRGGIASVNLNVGNNTNLFLNAYYTINNVNTTITKQYTILIDGDTSFSILHGIMDLKRYIGTGFFGLTAFGLNIIAFFVIAITTGILCYKYGLYSPGAIAWTLFFITAIMDFGLGLITYPSAAKVPFIASIVTFFTAILITIREGAY